VLLFAAACPLNLLAENDRHLGAFFLAIESLFAQADETSRNWSKRM
jgi:hypothetical protein